MDTVRKGSTAIGGLAGRPPWLTSLARQWAAPDRFVLSSFQEGFMAPGVSWRGFSDRVMGGISNARLHTDRIAGRSCIRLSGNVTRENNGGFIQMAMYFERGIKNFEGGDYAGIDLLVFGNKEEYNIHVKTGDCRRRDQSYRFSFFAAPEWQRLRVPWNVFTGNNIDTPLNPDRLQRIALLGWMREFDADIALAELSLYR